MASHTRPPSLKSSSSVLDSFSHPYYSLDNSTVPHSRPRTALEMDSPLSHDYSLQRRPPRPKRTHSSTANASGTASAEDPFSDRASQSPHPATDTLDSLQRHPRSASALSSSTAPGGNDSAPGRARYFHSRRVRKDEVIKPWVREPKDPAEKWIEIIPLIGLLIGLGLAGVLIWDGLRNVVEHKYCPVLDMNMAASIGNGFWYAEQQKGGFGLVTAAEYL